MNKIKAFYSSVEWKKCRETYRYEFKQTAEFLFIILDYLYKDLNNNNNKKIKEKLIHYNIYAALLWLHYLPHYPL